MRMKVLFVAVIILFFQSPLIVNSLEEGYVELTYRSVTVYAPAVAETKDGLTGIATVITVTVQNGTGCSGKVFVETVPLTEVDMQGSARLAVSVAGSLTGIDITSYDFFFVIKTSSPIIGGPSAGAIMTVATIAALKGWELDNRTMMTGMINPDGSIGPVGGIKEKIDAAHSVGARRFLIPKGQMIVYTTVTKTIKQDGWIRIYTEKKEINISEYARENYGIEVIEVEDINDAIYYFTGYRFEEPKVDKNITTEKYINSMKPLAENLLLIVRKSYEDASKLLNETRDLIPNFFPLNYRDSIEDSLKASKDALIESERSYNDGLFYSSTSKSFQSLINSRFVTYACEYFSSMDKKGYTYSILTYAKDLYNKSKDLANNANISGFISLQCVGAAQKRLFEAEAYIEEAEEYYNKGDYLNSLYRLAFSVERCNSVGWWINISSKFGEEIEIDKNRLEEIANKYLDLARNSVMYSQIILQEIGESSSLMNEAIELLDEAGSMIRDYPASSLFTSLEALTKANLAIEILGGSEKDRLERIKDKAAIEIGESRNYGVEPVLAVSYYEFAETLENKSVADSIVYYRYAQMIAGALKFSIAPVEEKRSRFEGIPPINPITSFLPNFEEILNYMMWIAMYIGVFLLVMVIFVSIISNRRKFRKEFPPETW